MLVDSKDHTSFDIKRRRLRRLEQAPGFLEKLTDVPLDVLFEIFGYLHPLDLLHLARTTKSLRSILMKRSSRYVWSSAICNVPGLPPCPTDLTEPQYTNLAFNHHCNFCSTPGVQDIFWKCRVRCCKNCIEANFVSDYDLRKLLPTSPMSGRIKAIFPYIVYPKPRPYKPGRILFYLPVAEEYMRELGELNDMSVRQWSIRKTEEQDRRLTHAALCENWSNHWVHERSSEVNLMIIVFLGVVLILMNREYIF